MSDAPPLAWRAGLSCRLAMASRYWRHRSRASPRASREPARAAANREASSAGSSGMAPLELGRERRSVDGGAILPRGRGEGKKPGIARPIPGGRVASRLVGWRKTLIPGDRHDPLEAPQA